MFLVVRCRLVYWPLPQSPPQPNVFHAMRPRWPPWSRLSLTAAPQPHHRHPVLLKRQTHGTINCLQNPAKEVKVYANILRILVCCSELGPRTRTLARESISTFRRICYCLTLCTHIQYIPIDALYACVAPPLSSL